jgi:hypothetical protein
MSRYAEDTSYWHPALTHAIKDIRVSYERKMETTIMDINESLSKITTKMVKAESNWMCGLFIITDQHPLLACTTCQNGKPRQSAKRYI